MNKTCARCEKTVYPTEELKCLDKVWHKGCFKCQECGMTLNMRTYKGYGKLPYCEAHVPKAKHTTMAETPELKRIAENTKIQSNVTYHAAFEKSKGKFTQVADDPETLRIKANSKIISNVAYHGDLEKKAQMERQRGMNENGELVDVPSDNYHQQLESYATEMLPPAQAPHLPPKSHYQTPNPTPTQYNKNYKQEYKNDFDEHNQNKHDYQSKPDYQKDYHQTQHQSHQHQSHQSKADYHQSHQSKQDYHQTHQSKDYQTHQGKEYEPEDYPNPPAQYDQYYRQKYDDYYQPPPPQQFKHQGHQGQSYDDYQSQHQHQSQGQGQSQYAYGQFTPSQPYGVGNQHKIGRIQDYDPLSDGPRPVPNTQRASSTLIYNSDSRKGSAMQTASQPRHIGRVTDMDPLAHEHHASAHGTAHAHGNAHTNAQRPQPPHVATNQRVYIAMYDYQANDSDEVSFREGDLISNVTSIDEGWMTGQVLRTGRAGMLPANYVELASTAANNVQ